MSLVRDAKNVLFAAAMLGATVVSAQTRQSQPVVDSAAQASPVGPALNTEPTDSSAEASPIDEQQGGKRKVNAPHTALHIVLTEGIDSGNLKNGQLVHGRLESISSHTRAASKSGAPVVLTVIGTVPVGKLNAVGEISLEVVRVGGQTVETNILTFRGEPGHRDLPDSAPMIGTNAGLPAGTALIFHVQPLPTFAESATRHGQAVPGSVTKHVSGSKPQNYGQPTVSSSPGSGVGKSGAPVGNASEPAHPAANPQEASPSVNQTTAPGTALPASTSNPH